MRYFPFFADTKAMRVLIVGAGEVASRKLELVKRTLADITVISPKVTAYIEAESKNKRITLYQRAVCESDIVGFNVIYLATANKTLNNSLAKLAKKQNAWVNVVDMPSECNFITPSIVDRDSLIVAISTAGIAPVYGKELRAKLETYLPNSLAPLFDFIAERRLEVQSKLPDIKERRSFWEQFFKANGERFDNYTQQHYINSYTSLKVEGELLLMNKSIEPSCLPLGVLPLFQRLDSVLTNEHIPTELNELLRRDSNRQAIPIDENRINEMLNNGERLLVYGDHHLISQLSKRFTHARYLTAGSY